jgi:hypothetical protein
MSDATRQFFESIKQGVEAAKDVLGAAKDGVQAVAPGLSFDNIVKDVKAEMGRLGVQGQMELASALFNGSSFVPYGPGQYTPTPEKTNVEPTHSPETPQQQQEQGGRSM